MLENDFAVSFVRRILGTLLTCRMKMSFPKVKGKLGESCVLREGAAPAWRKVERGLSPSSFACLS